MNWSREKWQSSERASALASIVLPTPGKSSTSTCPSATRQRTIRRSVSSGACMTGRGWRRSSGSARSGPVRQRAQPLWISVSTSSRIAAAISSFGAFATVRSPDAAIRVTSLSERVEADVRARHVVENEEIGALACKLRARALEAGLTGLGGEADEHLAVAAPLAQRREHVGRRLELERPGRPCPSGASRRAPRRAGSRRRPRP